MSMDSVHAAADREATAVEVMDHACVMYDDTLRNTLAAICGTLILYIGPNVAELAAWRP